MLTPEERRRARMLEDLPGRLGAVTVWWPASGVGDEGQVHHVPTLVACLAGVVRIERVGARLDLQPGEVLVLAPGTAHHHAQLTAGSIAFGQGFMHCCSDVLIHDHRGSSSGRIAEQPSRMLMERILAAGDAAARQTATAELLVQVLAEPVRPLEFDRHPAMRRMLRMFWGGLARGVTADDLVRASGLSRSRAWQLFTLAYGTTPYRALAEARLAFAAGLLDHGASVTDAARGSGFPDRRALTRAWRRAHGRPPTARAGSIANP